VRFVDCAFCMLGPIRYEPTCTDSLDRCYGYAQGVMGGLLTVPAFLERFPEVDIINSSSYHDAWVTGM
jgi:hypothetical protein